MDGGGGAGQGGGELLQLAQRRGVPFDGRDAVLRTEELGEGGGEDAGAGAEVGQVATAAGDGRSGEGGGFSGCRGGEGRAVAGHPSTSFRSDVGVTTSPAARK
jgi:hypothetical protein